MILSIHIYNYISRYFDIISSLNYLNLQLFVFFMVIISQIPCTPTKIFLGVSEFSQI